MTSSVLTAANLRRAALAVFVVVAFSWIFVLPVSHNEILYPLFGLIGLLAIVTLIWRNPPVDIHIWAIGFFVAALGLYGHLLGNNNPDPIITVAVYLAAPAMYLACVAAATLPTLRYLMIAAVFGTLAGTIVLLVFIAGEAGVIPQVVPHWVITNLDLKATFRDGSSQARSWGLSSLATLGPMWVASLLVRKHPLLPPWGLRLICAALALATAILSDRSAIVLVLVIAPVIALFLRVTLFRTTRTPIWRPRRPLEWIGIAVAGALAVVLVVPRLLSSGPIAGVLIAIGSFFGVAGGSGDADQSIRSDEAWYLLQAWAQDPIFGAGFRAAVPGYARASEIPWSLELQYHLLLFNVGLVGVTIALAALVGGILYVRKAIVARPDFLAILVTTTTGALAMLVANATNPYLVAPGHQWAVFLPLAVSTVALHTSPEAPDAVVGAAGTPRGSIVE